MTAPVLRAQRVTARFAPGAHIGPVDLELRPGEAVLVLGPSGAGKSTLLRMLHGAVPRAIHAETTGRVLVCGRDLADHGVADLADVVGVVAQDPESGVCLPEVDEEVAFPLENLGVPAARIGDAVTEALTRVGAERLRGRRTAELSGGEAQRVALAAASATVPALLLLDEPTAMLDADGVDAVRAAIARVRQDTGAAVVLVEHRLDDLAGEDGVDGLPARWVVLGRDGRVRHDGPARALEEDTARALLAEGCWLPEELEQRVLDGAAPVSPPVPVAAIPSPGRARETLRARGVRVLAGRPGRRRDRARTVLDDVDLEVHGGELVAVLGANGTGKSSLLRVLAGLTVPGAGEVQGPRAAMVFQNPEHQFVASTVRAELSAGGVPVDPARVEELLDRFGLLDLSDRNPFSLSGGQKRRLSIAAMLAQERPFLLADEPGFGLDRHAAVAVMRTLRAEADTGRGVLFASHDLRAVAAYADRAVVLADGGVLADTTPLALLQDPGLLVRARLRPAPGLRRRAAEAGGDPRALAGALRGADDAVLALRAEAAADETVAAADETVAAADDTVAAEDETVAARGVRR